MKNVVAALLFAGCLSVAHADPSLLGKWKSSHELTMKFNKAHVILEERQLKFLDQMMGRMTLTFAGRSVVSHMDSFMITSMAGKTSKFEGHSTTSAYRLVASTDTEVAVTGLSAFTAKRQITVHHFVDDDTMWVYVGGEMFPDLHIREYFVRVR
ncbi:MAG: hypothetical protein RLZZ618_2082 [Pseudomonadota bacterium]|jgi:hypothetical protein